MFSFGEKVSKKNFDYVTMMPEQHQGHFFVSVFGKPADEFSRQNHDSSNEGINLSFCDIRTSNKKNVNFAEPGLRVSSTNKNVEEDVKCNQM